MVIVNPEDYNLVYTDQFFFDTNVWILLFATIADYQTKDQKMYSKFLENLIRKDLPIFITSNILSEFSNVLLRRDFNQWKPKSGLIEPKFKENFVGSPEYVNSVYSINSCIKNIFSIPNIIKVSDDFSALNLDNILKNFLSIDYNDSYIAELCEIKNLKLVTNDNDFKRINPKITIITSQI